MYLSDKPQEAQHYSDASVIRRDLQPDQCRHATKADDLISEIALEVTQLPTQSQLHWPWSAVFRNNSLLEELRVRSFEPVIVEDRLDSSRDRRRFILGFVGKGAPLKWEEEKDRQLLLESLIPNKLLIETMTYEGEGLMVNVGALFETLIAAQTMEHPEQFVHQSDDGSPFVRTYHYMDGGSVKRDEEIEFPAPNLVSFESKGLRWVLLGGVTIYNMLRKQNGRPLDPRPLFDPKYGAV